MSSPVADWTRVGTRTRVVVEVMVGGAASDGRARSVREQRMEEGRPGGALRSIGSSSRRCPHGEILARRYQINPVLSREGNDVVRELPDAGLLPLAKRPAEKGGRATLATEDDDVIAEREIPVPRVELDAMRRTGGEDPVIAGFLLNSTDAGKDCR